MGVQANLPPPGLNENEQRTIHNTGSTVRRKTQRKRSPIQRIKSTKSIVLVNPEDQTIAVVENSCLHGDTIKPIIQRPRSSKRTRFQQDIVRITENGPGLQFLILIILFLYSKNFLIDSVQNNTKIQKFKQEKKILFVILG